MNRLEKKILVYGIDDKRDIIKKVSNDFEIEAIFLDEKDLSQKIGYLMGLPEFTREEEEELKEDLDFFIFSDFDREILKNFLVELNKLNALVPHKAVMTNTNKDWTLFYLIDHIKEEHEMVQKFRLLGTLVKKVKDIIDSGNDDENLKYAFEEALKLRGVELEMKSIDENLDRVREALKKYE